MARRGGFEPASASPISRVVSILRPFPGIVHDICAYPVQSTVVAYLRDRRIRVAIQVCRLMHASH